MRNMNLSLVLCLLSTIIHGIDSDDVPKTTTRKSSVLTITLKTTPAPKKTNSTTRRTTTTTRITATEYYNSSLEDSYENVTAEGGCDANFSCSSTTEMTNVTSADVSHTISISNKNIVSKAYKKEDYCTCDLQVMYNFLLIQKVGLLPR